MRYLDILRKKNKHDNNSYDQSISSFGIMAYELNEKNELRPVEANLDSCEINELNELNENSGSTLSLGCQLEWHSEVLGECRGQVILLHKKGWFVVQVHNQEATIVFLHSSRIV